jgi:hypothetical protein
MVYVQCKTKETRPFGPHRFALSAAAALTLSTVLVIASPTGVIGAFAPAGAGVLDRVGGAERLSCI